MTEDDSFVVDEALGLFEPAKFFAGIDNAMAVGTDGHSAVELNEFSCAEYTVSEVSFGGGAKADDGLGTR